LDGSNESLSEGAKMLPGLPEIMLELLARTVSENYFHLGEFWQISPVSNFPEKFHSPETALLTENSPHEQLNWLNTVNKFSHTELP